VPFPPGIRGRSKNSSVSEPIFLLAIHNHQPVGNFESVFEQSFRDCYEPLLDRLDRHPGFKFSLHFSGPLWEYMERREHPCLDLVGRMSARGQVELLGGGFYEPILPVIPEEDRLGQIQLMSDFLQRRFGARPRGAWLAERVWEPDLPSSLARAGVEYTLLDQEHFYYAGLEDIHTSYITEDAGRTVRVFPIDKQLRYLIPFHPVEEVRDYLAQVRSPGGLAILGDDGEKFGVWPGTHKLVYEDGWLEGFLALLEREGIRTLTLSECLDRFPPAQRVYLPPASYEEMMEWVLGPEELSVFRRLKEENPGPARRFLRGGFFRDFFRKYPESNNLHKRMILASRAARLHSDRAARRFVYMAQGNDPYWHGVFGGLYLPHLRQAAYRHLIEAEKRLPAEEGWSFEDYDSDGRPEAVYRGPAHSLFLKPSQGGTLVSLDSLRLCRNMLDVLSRRREAYHLHKSEDSGKGKSIHELDRPLPAGSERLFQYDLRPRYSLRDRFLEPGTAPESFVQGLEPEAGDFADGEYDFRPAKPRGTRADRQGVRELRLRRSGIIRLWGREFPLRLEKKIRAAKDGFEVGFELRNLGRDGLEFLFGSEWNFSAFPGEWEVEPGRAILRLFARSVSLEAPGAQGIWEHPLQTLSQSEKGYDIIHQGICCLVVWKVHLAGSGAWTSRLALREKSRG
jgi:hypothetical protein